MRTSQIVIQVAAVAAIAFGAGHWVESLHAPHLLMSQTPQKITLVSAGPEVLVQAQSTLHNPQILHREMITPAAGKPACDVNIYARPTKDYMIDLSLDVPCQAKSRIVVRHAGLAFSETLDDRGQLHTQLPALDKIGLVSILFANGHVNQTFAPVEGLENIRRFGVQWLAEDRFALHAMENGAGFGDPGHVWQEQPSSTSGGHLLTLGDPNSDLPMMAQVYTWPQDKSLTADVSIEAEVTDRTCDRELIGETFLSQAGSVKIQDLTLSMPDCQVLGDWIVMENVIPTETRAASN